MLLPSSTGSPAVLHRRGEEHRPRSQISTGKSPHGKPRPYRMHKRIIFCWMRLLRRSCRRQMVGAVVIPAPSLPTRPGPGLPIRRAPFRLLSVSPVCKTPAYRLRQQRVSSHDFDHFKLPHNLCEAHGLEQLCEDAF